MGMCGRNFQFLISTEFQVASALAVPSLLSVGTLLFWWMFIFCLKAPVKTPAGFQITRKRRSACSWKRLLLQGSSTTWKRLNNVVSGNQWNMHHLLLCLLQKEEVSSGTSEYFTASAENRKLKISLNEQIKQDILKEIVKRTKKRKSSMSKPQTSKDSKKVDLGSLDSQTENRKNDCQTSTSPQSEVKCRSTGQLKDCINTAESNLELPILEMENNVNQRQPEDTSSQRKPHSVERLKSRLLSKNPPCSYESALLDPKQNQKVTKTQAQQGSCGSEEKLDHFKKASSEEATLIPSNTEMTKCNDGCSGLFLEEKTPLNSRVFSKQDLTKTVSDEESLTLGKNLSQPPPVGHNVAQTNQNEPGTTTKELPAMSSSSCLELQPVPVEKPTQKRKKEGEDGLRKLKLRRLKKS
ncbi:protein SLX4IP isoform X13 [Anas acuta]|uniref:protein SLX4IP isoform X13 n=2 Tax=Anas acuta TaxID=28680 RepID=UPI0035C88C7C